MRFKVNLKSAGITAWCILFFTAILNGQTYSFRNFGAESDIPNGFVYTINQSDNGYLWIGTGSGLSRFDGISFFNVTFPDSSLGRYPTSSFKDSRGTLWFGCNDGSAYYTINNTLVQVPISNTRSISAILEDYEGKICIIPQGKSIFRVDPENPEEISECFYPSNVVVFSASLTTSGNLLIGTQENVIISGFSTDSVLFIDIIEGFDYSSVTAIHSIGNGSEYLIGTDGNGLFKLELSENGNNLMRLSAHPEWKYLRVQSISMDSDSFLWVSTFESGVIQIKFSDDNEINSVRTFNTGSGLVEDDVKSVFQDVEGNYWIGLYGEGLSLMTSFAFAYYLPGDNSKTNNIIYVKDYKGRYLLGTPSGFHVFDPSEGRSVSFVSLEDNVGKTDITSFHLDDDNKLWIGTGGGGLYVRNESGFVRLFRRTGDTGADYINDIEMDDHNVWLATTNGLFVLDKLSGVEKERFGINNGLPHNYIGKILLTDNGDVYVGTESDRLYIIDRDFNIRYDDNIMSGSTRNKILSLVAGDNGAIWAATKGNGVFEFFNDTAITVTRSNDLMSNYCYGVLADSKGNIWVGHEKGFSKINTVEDNIKVFGTDFVQIGVCNPNSFFESTDKKIIIGTTNGLVVYDSRNDFHRKMPPVNNINYITINDIKYTDRSSFVFPYGKYSVRINYIGINMSNPTKVFYSVYMENYDNDWSAMTTTREIPYGLSDGKYRFNLLSVNEENLSSETLGAFQIIIKPPFWRRWWFVLSFVIVVVFSVIIIIRIRERAQKKTQEYLEKELEARTSVVMKQKGELELQNIEITDSINYAKRIQSSILPDINKLKEVFNGAFILFHPRDIVSGDFYWFDKIDDNKFIVVCADSTGHGVPGAFMSMIGSTLLQDIVTRQRISQPSEILRLLNQHIFSTINQNLELGVSNDGMDMVVCEFNTKTRHLRFASAMRPVIIVIEGESYYIKGNRLSIGGESVMEKFFDDQDYYLNSGDTVYLFSDGLPDQFGGKDGKKMKVSRLKRMIDQMSSLPMDEQDKIISDFFIEWKGDYDQVDDVLLMGLRV